MTLLVAFVVLLLCGTTLSANNYQFGTYYKLFNPQSLWNSRPVNPVFSNDARVIVKASIYNWSAQVSDGSYSTGVFLATASDPAVTVYALNVTTGVNDVDALGFVNNVTLPHWPPNAVAATGTDGHLDIVDEVTGIIHSFWKLSFNTTSSKWVAQQYAWSDVNGYGFGDPAHYFQGARAAGVPTSAGIIRTYEIDDGDVIYNHVLAMSLAHNSLATNPAYIYPATSADENAAYTNSGLIPEGALLMLPPTYDTSIHDSYPKLKKVAETLKVYGAYVVDRNVGTPFAIYVENTNTNFTLSNSTTSTWNIVLAGQLDTMRAALRMVVSADKYLDGNGNTLVPRTNMNLISMRTTSTWFRQSGDATVRFDTLTQALVYDGNNTQVSRHANTNNLGYNKVRWGQLVANKTYEFSVESQGNVALNIQNLKSGTVLYQSGFLTNGQSVTFVYSPASTLYLIANKQIGGPGFVRGILKEVNGTGILPPITPDAATSTTSNPTTTDVSTSTGVDPSDDNSSSGFQLGLCSSLFALLAVLILM